MAFRLTQKPTFKARVTVTLPNLKGGFDTSQFMGEFKRCTTDEILEYEKDRALSFLPKVLVGWSEMIGDADELVPYNDENLHTLLQISNALIGVRDAFWDAVRKAPEKN